MHDSLIKHKTSLLAYKKGLRTSLFVSQEPIRVKQIVLQAWLKRRHNILVVVVPIPEIFTDNGGRDGNMSYSKDTITKRFQAHVYQDYKHKATITAFEVTYDNYYESALEAGLYYGLKLIKIKK